MSIYIRDPNKNMVEFCHTTRAFTDEERARAADVLLDPAPELDRTSPKAIVHEPLVGATAS